MLNHGKPYLTMGPKLANKKLVFRKEMLRVIRGINVQNNIDNIKNLYPKCRYEFY